MPTRAASIFCLGVLSLAAAYAVLNYGGLAQDGWNITMVALGVTGVVLAAMAGRSGSPYPRSRLTLWAAVLFPAYAAFQLVPLPTALLPLISPMRAETAAALSALVPVHFTPLTIGPPRTWSHLSQIIAYAVVFLLVWETGRRGTGRPWTRAAPLIAIGSVEAALAWVQYFGDQSVSGTYANKDHLAGLLEMVLPFAVMSAAAAYYWGRELTYSRREAGAWRAALTLGAIALLALAVGIFLAIMFSFSRMGFISTLASLFVMGALALGSRLKGWKKWPAVLGLAGLILAAFVLFPTNELVESFGRMASDGEQGRAPIWRDTLHLIAAYPLFGCGLGNYYPAILKYQTSGLAFAWTEAHNDYLQLLSELGMVGFLIPAALMAMVFWRAARAAVSHAHERRCLGLACAGAMTAMLVHSLADFNLYDTANAMILSWICGLAAALPVGSRRIHRHAQEEPAVRRWAIPMPKLILALSVLLGVYGIASLVLPRSFFGNARAEDALCRLGICDTDGALDAKTRAYGGRVGNVPPDELVKFVQRDPEAPDRWEDLGESLQNAGDSGRARYSFRRALALGPRSPYMLVRAANFDFGLGEKTEALALMARALNADPSYSGAAFATYDQREIAPEQILSHGIPDAQAAQTYLDTLLGDGKAADAAKTWAWILSKGWADDKVAGEYVISFMQAKDYAAAARAWADYQGPRANGYLKSNYIFNGDFEADSAGSPFDWRLDQRAGFKTSIDSEVAYSGKRSARVRFDGTENVETIDLSQVAFVPAGRYRFYAYVKLDGVTTDQGVSFQISGERVKVETDNMTGTSDWRLVEKEFQLPASAGLVEVRLFRRRSWKADSLIKGTVWVDQVGIRPERAE